MIRDLKKNAVLLLQVLFLSFACVVTFSSCSDDVENPLPPAPFPTNELVDQSINPGDDFYNYCNGTWIKEHPLAPGVRANMFWTNEQYSNAMFQKKILESNDPVIKKLMQDIDNRVVTEASVATLREKTNKQLAEIEQIASIEEAMQHVADMSMKGYRSGIQLFSEPVEHRTQIVLEVILPQVASSEAWQEMTGCSESEAKTKVNECTGIISGWYKDVGIAIRTKPYAGNEVVDGRRLLAKAVGVPVERLIYGETIDQDIFMKKNVTEAQLGNWKKILANAIISYNYQWTHASKEELAAYLGSSLHPFAYRITKLYSETYKNEMMRDFVYQMVEEIREAFISMIENNDWMAASTRQAAIDKARKMDSFVGYPDTWQEQRLGSVPTHATLLEDMEQAGEEWRQIVLNSISDNPSRDDLWFSLSQATVAPYEMNAMNMTESNGLYMYMPMLLPNACRQNVPDSYNYAMVGFVAGHELGHGFDTAGYQFGVNGEWHNWWTQQDITNFKARTNKLAEYNSHYYPYPEIDPDMHTDGYQTSVEDVADLNGVNAALIAMVKHYKAKGASDEELLKAKREFFLGYANLWGGVFSYERIKAQMNDIHSISVLRVNGIVRHIDEWYDVYNIKPTDKLYLAPADRVRIWNK